MVAGLLFPIFFKILEMTGSPSVTRPGPHPGRLSKATEMDAPASPRLRPRPCPALRSHCLGLSQGGDAPRPGDMARAGALGLPPRGPSSPPGLPWAPVPCPTAPWTAPPAHTSMGQPWLRGWDGAHLGGCHVRAACCPNLGHPCLATPKAEGHQHPPASPLATAGGPVGGHCDVTGGGGHVTAQPGPLAELGSTWGSWWGSR